MLDVAMYLRAKIFPFWLYMLQDMKTSMPRLHTKSWMLRARSA